MGHLEHFSNRPGVAEGDIDPHVLHGRLDHAQAIREMDLASSYRHEHGGLLPATTYWRVLEAWHDANPARFDATHCRFLSRWLDLNLRAETLATASSVSVAAPAPSAGPSSLDSAGAQGIASLGGSDLAGSSGTAYSGPTNPDTAQAGGGPSSLGGGTSVPAGGPGINPASVPEPSSIAMLALALVACGGVFLARRLRLLATGAMRPVAIG